VAKGVIITCAVTGSLHTPTMSPYLPITPAHIARESLAAARAGAAILHLHARDPLTGRPTADPAVFRQFLRPISEATDAVINITTGGAPGMTMDERLAAPEAYSPEMTSLNMGTINVGLFPILEKLKEFKFDWERPFLEGTRGGIFRNTFEDIQSIVNRLGKGHGSRFEFECYDLGHLTNLAWVLDQKLYEPPIFIQFCLGILGGIAAEVDQLVHMVRTAQRLFGADIEWSVLAAGRHQMPMATHNILMGGNARVGLEDSLSLEKGRLATSNSEQVAKIARILGELGYQPATPNDVRQRLGLKGAAQTRF
jgi:uncharacterized protein (DUF849 family)